MFCGYHITHKWSEWLVCYTKNTDSTHATEGKYCKRCYKTKLRPKKKSMKRVSMFGKLACSLGFHKWGEFSDPIWLWAVTKCQRGKCPAQQERWRWLYENRKHQARYAMERIKHDSRV